MKSGENKRIYTKLERKLLIGLIVSLVVTMAMIVGAGVAVSGLSWYGEQVDGLNSDNKKLQDSIGYLQDDIKAERELTNEANREIRELNSRIEELKAQIVEDQSEASYLQQQLDIAKGNLPVYPKDAKLVALTFDDGPASSTERLLDILRAKRAPATFFVLGSQAEKKPDILKRIADEGHAIGTHTYSHSKLTKMTPDEMAADIGKSCDIILNITGKLPTLLRPPGGHYDDNTLSYAKEQNMKLIMWSVDTRDWESKDPVKIMEQAFQEGQYGMHDGAIVLMHDIHAPTVDTVGEMIDRLYAEGYTLVTVPELLRVRAENGGEAGEVYRSAPAK